MNKIEQWKNEKHGLDVWPDVLHHAAQQTPMKAIDNADLERMKWHGVFYRKRDTPGSYMLRIRLTGCELSAPQAKEIAYIAYELGHGIVDVTTRANLQIQGLSIRDVPRAVARLEACGLTAKQTGHDNIRNVFGHPMSGVDPDELIDTRTLCRDISAIFLDSRTYSDLPRKMNIAVSGKAPHGIHYWTQDISFLACVVEQGRAMFQMLIGGTQGQNPQLARHCPVLVAPEQVTEVTRALLDMFREKGSRDKRDRTRFRFLVDDVGVSGVLDYLEQKLAYPLRPYTPPPLPPAGYEELVGWFRQAGAEQWALGVSIPLGRLSWQQLEGLARLSKKWGSGQLRTTHEQGLLVLDVPTGFKDAAATDVAAQGLSHHADTLQLNTVACTGKQFCNIAVTETKGQMFRLIEQLRQRALNLHGIRIHMSGCPSSCAQHFTADIGLKGVRVRRLLGTREGFDVFLGGGIAGEVHLALPYRLGVDADQLPQLVEEVVREYYLKHKGGQTFSAYWREKLRDREAEKVDGAEYSPPTWVCDACHYEHRGEDPPVYCPSCAGLRRHFARLEDSELDPAQQSSEASPSDGDGFIRVASVDQLSVSQPLAVEAAGRELVLMLVGEEVVALDDECPHQGAPLSQGTLQDGVLTCPWHSWTFQACSGCSIKPRNHQLLRHDTKVEQGNVYVRITSSGLESSEPLTSALATET